MRGSITIFVSLTVSLLVVERDGRARVGGHRASFRRARGTLFRHACTTALPVRSIVIAVIGTTLLGPLMPSTARAQRPPACLVSTPQRAIAVTAIAPPAQEKHLAAAALGARYEAKRVQAPGREPSLFLETASSRATNVASTKLPVAWGSVL
jgi:hypothetical protein